MPLWSSNATGSDSSPSPTTVGWSAWPVDENEIVPPCDPRPRPHPILCFSRYRRKAGNTAGYTAPRAYSSPPACASCWRRGRWRRCTWSGGGRAAGHQTACVGCLCWRLLHEGNYCDDGSRHRRGPSPRLNQIRSVKRGVPPIPLDEILLDFGTIKIVIGK